MVVSLYRKARENVKIPRHSGGRDEKILALVAK
jgi:hypothetical protein